MARSDKDWTGNRHSVVGCLGASNHTKSERQERDYYATDPKASEELLKFANLDKGIPIWECACGGGHLAEPMIRAGYNVILTDIQPLCEGGRVLDFLKDDPDFTPQCIITNPPYRYSLEFVLRALDLLPSGGRLFMFLKVQWLEGQRRRALFDTQPPIRVWVSSSRLRCGKNGVFEDSMLAFAWFEWQKGYKGDTILKWFN